jgi:peroxiredoxin Q/BCP
LEILTKTSSILKPGDPAPGFEGVDENGSKVKLSDFRGRKLVLFFYPKDNTPGCTAEACNLRDHYQELKENGFELLGISPDGEKSHQRFRGKHKLPFPLIADEGKTIINAYQAWGDKKLFGVSFKGVLRRSFVIDEEGRIERIIDKVRTKDHAAQILESN